MKLNSGWLAAVVIVAVFGYLVFACAGSVPVDYWILKDGAETKGVVTDDNPWVGHGNVTYSYAVNGQEYTETGHPDWEKPTPKVGDKCTVYYSVSRPWLSLLRKPKVLVERYAVAILFFFCFCVAALWTLISAWVRRRRRRRFARLYVVVPPPLPLRSGERGEG